MLLDFQKASGVEIKRLKTSFQDDHEKIHGKNQSNQTQGFQTQVIPLLCYQSL